MKKTLLIIVLITVSNTLLAQQNLDDFIVNVEAEMAYGMDLKRTKIDESFRYELTFTAKSDPANPNHYITEVVSAKIESSDSNVLGFNITADQLNLIDYLDDKIEVKITKDSVQIISSIVDKTKCDDSQKICDLLTQGFIEFLITSSYKNLLVEKNQQVFELTRYDDLFGEKISMNKSDSEGKLEFESNEIKIEKNSEELQDLPNEDLTFTEKIEGKYKTAFNYKGERESKLTQVSYMGHFEGKVYMTDRPELERFHYPLTRSEQITFDYN